MPFYDNLDVIDYLYTKLTTERSALGLGFVGYADEELLPSYPAAVLSSGSLAREVHSTVYFKNEILVDIFILHARLTTSRKARTREDLLLCRAIVLSLHGDRTLGGNIVDGHVASEVPGEVRDEQGEAVVGTRITWYGQTREPTRRP